MLQKVVLVVFFSVSIHLFSFGNGKIEWGPQELWEHTLSFVDRKTKNNLSLVSDAFHQRVLAATRSIKMFSGISNETDERFGFLTKISHLQNLHLYGYWKKVQLSPLSSLQYLKKIELSAMYPYGVEQLPSSIQHIAISNCYDLPKGMHIPNSKNLVSLELKHISSSHIKNILQVSTTIQNLLIDSYGFSTPSLWLSRLTQLTRLIFGNANLIGRDIHLLSHLTKLQTLSLPCLNGLEDNENVLEALSHLTHLTELNLNSCGFHLLKQGEIYQLSFISALTNLRQLNLRFCHNLTDEVVKHLSAMTNMQRLDLAYSRQITDKSIEHLSDLTNLKYLSLECCQKLTQKSIQNLSRFQNLNQLDMTYCNTEAIRSLALLSHLSKLRVSTHLLRSKKWYPIKEAIGMIKFDH